MRSRLIARFFLRAAFVAAGVVLGAGCGGSQGGALRPGMTAFDVGGRLASGCELARVALSVDGDLKYAAAPPDPRVLGAGPREVVRMALPAGSHALGILASAACKSDELGGDPVVLALRDYRSFLVGEAPATLVLDLNTKEEGGAGDRRLDVAVSIRGGELGPALGSSGPLELEGSVDGAGVDSRHCKALEVAPRAICRTEAMLVVARAQKDILRVVCAQDRLSQMRTYATIIERAKQRAAGAAAGSAEEDATIIRGAEDRVRALEVEVDHCVGEDIMKTELGGDSVKLQ